MSSILNKIRNFIILGPGGRERTFPVTDSPKIRAWTSDTSSTISKLEVKLGAASNSCCSPSSDSASSYSSKEQATENQIGKNRSFSPTSSSDFDPQNPPTSISKMGTGNGSATETLMEKQADKLEPRVFKKRWLILVIFIMLSASNGAQWIQYSIIANIIVQYYDVSYQAVDWTSMIYMLTYIFLFIPAAWILDKHGLRLSVLLGAFGNCIGAWVKLLSTHPDSFWVTFLGQTIVGASQMFTLGIPPRLAAVWFGPDEVSRACAAGVFGNQLGIALGFVLPPMIVSNGTTNEITYDLNTLFLGSAVLNTIILALVICFFPNRPKVPPSLAQLTAQEGTFDNNFWGTLKKLMTSRDFLLLFITYGINTGVFYAISTLLSQMVLSVYPNESVAVGQVGLLIVVAGMFGSVVGGILLDKFKKFKLTTILIYLFSFIGMLSFTLTIDLDSMALVFVNAALLGFFMTGYLPIGFEFAAEITYPAAEGTTSGLLNASAQIFGIALTWLMGIVMHSFGTMTSNFIMSSCLIVGTVITCLIREDLKRQKAHSVQCQIPTSETQLTSCTIQSEHF